MRSYGLAVIIGLAGLAGLTAGAALIMLDHGAPEPAPAVPERAAEQASATQPPSETRETPAQAAAPAAPDAVPAAPPPTPPASDLPSVDVAPRLVHGVPDADEPPPPVTLVDRNGRTIKEIKPAAPLSPTYVPSVGPAPNRPGAPPSRVASAPGLAPQATNSRVPTTPASGTFAGAAAAAGGTVLSVGGRNVRLFGVRLADARDQCGLGVGDRRNCADVARDALAQRLLRYPRVACRVPPGQRGDPAAICSDGSGTDLGGFLVAEGYALADVSQSYDYFGAEGVARSSRRGLWRYR
jgi:endonuclease YncB( thermonuclease family)